jgi:periodic tryptophan protein 1
VQYFDTRKGSNSEALFTLAAHSKAVTSVDWNPALPNCLLTVSVDKTFKLWNTLGEITCVASREAVVGKIFTGSFCFDTPNLVAIAGGKGVLSVFNLLSDVALVEAFKSQSS